MELARRSISCLLRARISGCPLRLTATRVATDYTFNQTSPQTSSFLAKVSFFSTRPAIFDTPPPATNHNTISHPVPIERYLHKFESRCQLEGKVEEKSFVEAFATFTRRMDQEESPNQRRHNPSESIAIFLRCCGRLMFDAEPKIRQLLAANVWEYAKQKGIPLDISHYNCLIRVLNDNHTVFDPQAILSEMITANITPDRVTYQRLILQYCLQGNIEGATKLLEKMKELDMELNELTFAALITGYNKQETPPSMDEMFELMRSNGVEPTEHSYAAAIIALADRLSKDPSVMNQLQGVVETVLREEVTFPIHEAVNIMTKLVPFKEEKVFADLIDDMTKKIMNGPIGPRAHFCNALLKLGQYELASKSYWLSREPSQRSMLSGRAGVYYVKLLAKSNAPHDHILEECDRLKRRYHTDTAIYVLYHGSAQCGNLELARSALNEIKKEKKVRCFFYWPFIAQAKNEQEVIDVLKNDLHPNDDPDDLIDTFSDWVWPKLGANATKLFEANKELKYQNNLLVFTLLKYLVSHDKLDDAIKFISEVSLSPEEEPRNDEPHRMLLMSSSIGTLLKQVADKSNDPALIKKTLDLSVLTAQKLSVDDLNPLINAHLANNDFEGAMKEFIELATKHRLAPSKRTLMTICLDKQYPDQLQKIMDVLTELYGENNALFDLANCCIQSGRLNKAKRIYSSPNLRVHPRRVYHNFQLIAKTGNINMLENFVDLSRHMYDVEPDRLYRLLLEVYDQTSDHTRALNLWNKMQEEEYRPSNKSLLMIARILEKKNVPVPFQKPTTP